ncbi:MAG TPA: hypothetical protein VFU47_07010, partial [Armatimonadota bacterium]|nr:hypothetical protein [Armatimonadota bacterium]
LGPILARRLVGGEPARIRWAIAASFLMGGLWYVFMSGARGLAGVAAFLLLARLHGAIVWVFSTILLQILTADRFRGRVFALETSLFTAAMMLSSIATTQALDRYHFRVSHVAFVLGLLSLFVGLLWTGALVFSRRPTPALQPEEAAG